MADQGDQHAEQAQVDLGLRRACRRSDVPVRRLGLSRMPAPGRPRSATMALTGRGARRPAAPGKPAGRRCAIGSLRLARATVAGRPVPDAAAASTPGAEVFPVVHLPSVDRQAAAFSAVSGVGLRMKELDGALVARLRLTVRSRGHEVAGGEAVGRDRRVDESVRQREARPGLGLRCRAASAAAPAALPSSLAVLPDVDVLPGPGRRCSGSPGRRPGR